MSNYVAGGQLTRIDSAEDLKAIERFVQDADHGRYARTILIGLGGTGAKALQHLRQMLVERFGRVNLSGVTYLSMDTDVQSIRPEATKDQSPYEELVSFQEEERLNVSANLNAVLENMARHPYIKEWWDDSALDRRRNFELSKGAGQIRPLSRLVFFQNREDIQEALERCWTKVTAQDLDDARIKKGKVRVVVIAGWAGGTGSGMFLDLGALIKSTFDGRGFDLEGLFVLPGVFKGVDTKFAKLGANGYAALRETNHYLSNAFEAQWDHHARASVKGLYSRMVLLSGTNALGESMANASDAYKAIGELLFLDFAGGPIKSWVEGVRINREQYLTSFVGYRYMVEDQDGKPRETHADKFRTAFSTFGISKLVYPSWRLLNFAKYDLTAEMVRLLDPGRASELGDVITEWRMRFMIEGGFFQGTRVDEEGRSRRVYQVRDALAAQKGTRTASSSIFEHIVELGDELRSLADEMFHEKSTLALGKEKWREVRKLYGDPYSPGNEGDWSIQIVNNREAYVRQVRKDLPRVIEAIRSRKGVGITGVRQILENVIEELDRPHDRAMFIDWLRVQRTEKQREVEERRKEWEKLLNNADEASQGSFLSRPSTDNHAAALDLAADAFVAYWRAQVTEFICVEGIKALEAIKKALSDQLTRIDLILTRMRELEHFYLDFRDSFREPRLSTMFIELPVQHDLDKLLEPYLGSDAQQRQERLERLLERSLRAMGVQTLEDLELSLSGKVDTFRQALANEAFFALKGDDTGRTAAFIDDSEESQTGFLHRYSVLSALESMPKERVKELLKQLYDKGLPWVKPTPKDPTGGAALKPVADAFFGCNDVEGRQIKELHTELARQQPHGLPFKPNLVRTNDPSELVFLTEWNAFAAYFVGELHGANGLKSHYEKLLYDPVRPEALHIHTDFHTFQHLVPLEETEVRWEERAWKLFHQAQMMGVICSRRRRHGDDTRVSFTRRKRATALDTTWEELGVEATLIRNLMVDRAFIQSLTADIEHRIQELLDAGGDYADLVAMADYWTYCVYPVVAPSEQSGAAVTAVQGSLENLAMTELRKEWERKALASMSREELLERRFTRIRSLADWTRPVAKSVGLPVPTSADVPDELRVDVWTLLPQAREQVRELVRRRELRESRDEYGNAATQFPRLAIRWNAFRPPADVPAEARGAGARYWYKGDAGTHQDLSMAQVVAHVRAAPSGRHRVFARGWPGWKDALTLSEVSEALEGAPVPVDEGPLYHYAVGKERHGKRTAVQVAAEVAAAPALEHKVWLAEFGRDWKRATEVPAIAALVPDDEPPPLDDVDEPPPL